MSGVHLVVEEYAEGVQVNVESDGKISNLSRSIISVREKGSLLPMCLGHFRRRPLLRKTSHDNSIVH